MKTITSLQTIKKISKQLHEKGKTIVLAGGCFDLIHIGHVTFLENAKKHGDSLIVFVESDNSVKKRKGINRPIHSQKQRAHLISALQVVDFVILLPDSMTNDDYDTFVSAVHPDIIAITKPDKYLLHKKRQAELVGARIVPVNTFIPSISTTKILEVLSKEL